MFYRFLSYISKAEVNRSVFEIDCIDSLFIRPKEIENTTVHILYLFNQDFFRSQFASKRYNRMGHKR